MSTRRARRQTLRQPVEEAMRWRLSGRTGSAQLDPPANGELFPHELEVAIDAALRGLRGRPGRAGGTR